MSCFVVRTDVLRAAERFRQGQDNWHLIGHEGGRFKNRNQEAHSMGFAEDILVN
jgi:hypothetical protein